MTKHLQGNRPAGQIAAVAVTTTLLIIAAAVGGVTLWQNAGSTRTLKADCKEAQDLFFQTAGGPASPADAKKWEADLRNVRNTKIQDQGLSTQMGRYISWKAAEANGRPAPTEAEWQEMVSAVTNHCAPAEIYLAISR